MLPVVLPDMFRDPVISAEPTNGNAEPPPAEAIEADTLVIPGKDKTPSISVLPVIFTLPDTGYSTLL